MLAACGGGGGSSGLPPPTESLVLTAAPTTVASGGASMLTWSSANALSCTASGGWSGAKGTSGSQSTGALTATTTYTLTCTGTGGVSATATATVTTTPTTAPTVGLAANPAFVTTNGAATLTWTSTTATSCTASGGWSGTRGTSGSYGTGALTATTPYSLTCSGAGGTTSNTVTVTVFSGTMAPSNAAIAMTQVQQFIATIAGGGGATWSVDGIAGGSNTVGIVSATGLYTAVAGTAAGKHNVVATSIADPSQAAGAVVVVTDLPGVYTYHNDLARDGVNMREYALTPANVNTAGFGKLFSCTADGAIYGQPLWVAQQTVNGSPHNVVIVATQHDSLFAFDADASPCMKLWSASLIDMRHGAAPGEIPVPSGLLGSTFGDITPEVGVTGTPVIDAATNTLYVVSKSVDATKTIFYQRLHAIDVTTGAEKPGAPAVIAAMVPGTGDGGTSIAFSAQLNNQRAGLALINGSVYVAWGSHEDLGTFHGWIMGYTYNGFSFVQSSVFNVTPNGTQGGIWMSGSAIAADSNNKLYAISGNGTFDASTSGALTKDYGDTLMQLNGSLTVTQYFTPSDQAADFQGDVDFGSGGVVLADLPAGSSPQHLAISGDKNGSLYVLDRDFLRGFGSSNAVQVIPANPMNPYRIFATGAFWNNYFYIAGVGGPLEAYVLNASTAQFSMGSSSAASFGFPGGSPSVSAAGTQSGIVWILDTNKYCTTQSPGCGPAVLHAYDATNVATELWNSSVAPTGGDAAGNAVKFAVPTIANGKVYVGTRGNNTGGNSGSTSVSGELDVYGLKP